MAVTWSHDWNRKTETETRDYPKKSWFVAKPTNGRNKMTATEKVISRYSTEIDRIKFIEEKCQVNLYSGRENK